MIYPPRTAEEKRMVRAWDLLGAGLSAAQSGRSPRRGQNACSPLEKKAPPNAKPPVTAADFPLAPERFILLPMPPESSEQPLTLPQVRRLFLDKRISADTYSKLLATLRKNMTPASPSATLH